MKCRLNKNPYTDDNFQIEFTSIKEIEELRNSLTSMIKYYNICETEGEETGELIYRIETKKNNLKK